MTGEASDPVTDVLAKAREALRAVARERRDAALGLAAAQKDVGRIVGAAVEALETLEETVGACLDQLAPSSREALKAAIRSAWQGLEAAGVVRDGAVGEGLDLARHRVVKTLAAAEGPRVLEVVAPGIVFKGGRVRPAVVVAGARREGGDGPDRD